MTIFAALKRRLRRTSEVQRAPPSRQLEFSVDLAPGFGHDRVHVALSIPALPSGARDVRFMEHRVDRTAGHAPTGQVFAAARGGVVVSDDAGATWRHQPIPGLADFRIRNVFTTSEGLHLLQEIEKPGDGPQTRLAICGPDWGLLDIQSLTHAPWHGSRSIDEAAGVIMFAEYPGNFKRGVPNAPDQAVDHDKNSRVFRSRDGGRSWDVAFEVSWRDIRHFHTLIADPFVERCWWLSSGDQFQDCRVWRSDDDGDSWMDMTIADPDYPAPARLKGRRQAAYRYTDAVILPDGLLWGSDDWLGGSAGWDDPSVPQDRKGGSRVFWAPRGASLQPEMTGYIGCPVRSIVDVGPAWLLLTEAKHPNLIPGAQVCLLSKQRPMTLQQIYLAPILDGRKSGFSASIASAAAKNGRVFTQRGPNDIFEGGARILQWDFKFD